MTKPENKPQLLLVTDFFYPHWTGIAKSVFSLTKELQRTFAITVLTVRFDKKLPRHEKMDTVTVWRSKYFMTISRAKYSFSILWDFIRLVRKTEYVFINSPCANIVFFSLLTKLFNKKLLIFHQGDLILPAGFSNRFIEKIFDLSCYFSFLFADKISTYTQDYAKHSRVIRPFLKKFTPVLLPILLPPKTMHSRLERLEKLKQRKKVLFGFAGRFVEEKGFDILIRSIPFVIKHVPDAHFVIAGQEMPYETFFTINKALLDSVKDHVTFFGLLHDSQLSQFYHDIDCIIVPSRSDCFNLVQAEAMLCGTPAIVSDIPGLSYLVKKSGFGLLFASGDYKDLARKISTFVQNRSDIMKSEKKLQSLLDRRNNDKKAREFITS